MRGAAARRCCHSRQGSASGKLKHNSPYGHSRLEDINPLLEKIKVLGSADPGTEIKDLKTIRDTLDLPFLQDEMGQLLRGINNGTQRTAEIVQNLKYFSRSDHGRKSPINMLQVIDTTLEIMHNELKRITRIEKKYEPLPLISANPGQFNQVFFNILTNAADAIKAKHPPQDPPLGLITISTRVKGDEAVISIADNGIGISSLVSQKVFDPFFTTKGVGEGAGLGLSMSHGVIEQHNG
ncbi:MAG: ATP-binding protein, partial [Pseudomonadota bacterium]